MTLHDELNMVQEKLVRLTSNDKKFKIYVHMDFTDVSHEQLIKWAFQSQTIAMQRVLRECSSETLNDFEENGYEVHALVAGVKPRTNREILNDAKNAIATLSEEQKAELLEQLMG